MPDPLLLATHITVAIALTITVGAQSAELARIRAGAATDPALRTLRAGLWSTPILALLTFITRFPHFWFAFWLPHGIVVSSCVDAVRDVEQVEDQRL